MSRLYTKEIGRWTLIPRRFFSSAVERWSCKPKVGGSSPPRSSILHWDFFIDIGICTDGALHREISTFIKMPLTPEESGPKAFAHLG